MIKRGVLLCGLTAGLLMALNGVCRGQDNPVVSKLFSDHMVLQRDMSVPVWGTAKPGMKVTVKFGTPEKTAEADKDGKWLVRLDALRASVTPAELLITSATGNQPVKIVESDRRQRASAGGRSWGGQQAGGQTAEHGQRGQSADQQADDHLLRRAVKPLQQQQITQGHGDQP